MSGERPDRGADSLLDAVRRAGVEEGDVLLPGDADHHVHAVELREVEQPPLRGRVHAHGVDSAGGHLGEVALDGAVVEAAGRVGAEWPVGHTSDVQPLLSEVQRLAAHGRAEAGARGPGWLLGFGRDRFHPFARWPMPGHLPLR